MYLVVIIIITLFFFLNAKWGPPRLVSRALLLLLLLMEEREGTMAHVGFPSCHVFGLYTNFSCNCSAMFSFSNAQ